MALETLTGLFQHGYLGTTDKLTWHKKMNYPTLLLLVNADKCSHMQLIPAPYPTPGLQGKPLKEQWEGGQGSGLSFADDREEPVISF